MKADSATQPNLADLIAPHLPLLRRYARALTGAQRSGDAHVAALLEAVIADRGLIDSRVDPRVALYAAFQRMWRGAEALTSDAAPDGAPDSDREAAAHDRLQRLTPRSRQALLLTAVEGFTHAQAGQVLDVASSDVDSLVADAVAALKAQTRARILIVEDEPIIAMDLQATMAEMDHEVVGVADTHADAVKAATRHRPDLVLADIQLADGSSGIDAVQEILSAMKLPVIFITAYPDRLLTGARPEPTFLIAKPFKPETVKAAVSQALFFNETSEPA